jgi:dihydrofolate reductase
MSKVKADITMSLDGYIAGPNDKPGNGLGDGGERLHEWVYGLRTWRQPHGMKGGEEGPDADVIAEVLADGGATIVGRRMFDLAEEWGDNPPFHHDVFVVTHRPRQTLAKDGGTTFYFVDSIEGAINAATKSAGGKSVYVGGGASIIQQLIKAGMVDELQIHVAPVLLGGGRPLFNDVGEKIELEPTRVISSPKVTHIKYKLK